MNKRQLLELGVPEDCVADAVDCIHAAAKAKVLKQKVPKKIIPQIVATPNVYLTDEYFGPLARAIIEFNTGPPPAEPAEFRQWGEDIDNASKVQMQNQ